MDSEGIKKIRNSLKLNQEDFALLLGVHKITVSRWERGDKKPSILAKRQLQRLVRKNGKVDS